jgi:hypothetical protein
MRAAMTYQIGTIHQPTSPASQNNGNMMFMIYSFLLRGLHYLLDNNRRQFRQPMSQYRPKPQAFHTCGMIDFAVAFRHT